MQILCFIAIVFTTLAFGQGDYPWRPTFVFPPNNQQTEQLAIATDRMDLSSLWAPLRTLMSSHPENSKFRLPQRRHRVNKSRLPRDFDAREHWPGCPSIRTVPDQGGCAACWAVAAVDVMSDRICIHSQEELQVQLSARDVLACCTDCGKGGCRGGFPAAAWYHWIYQGIVSGGPYLSEQGCQPYFVPPCDHTRPQFWLHCRFRDRPPQCSERCDHDYTTDYRTDKHYGASAYSLRRKAAEIQWEIFTSGPVQATIMVYQDFLTYRSGIYKHAKGDALGYHSVRIIGWGEEYGVPYWIAINSWNTDWGENGSFRILRGKNHANIESFVIAGLPKLDER